MNNTDLRTPEQVAVEATLTEMSREHCQAAYGTMRQFGVLAIDEWRLDGELVYLVVAVAEIDAANVFLETLVVTLQRDGKLFIEKTERISRDEYC